MSGFEMLESRTMMAVLAGTDLQITGSDNNDVIRVSQLDAQTLRVEENGVVTFFSDASVSTIHVDAKAGNDKVEFLTNAAGTPNEAATIVGGAGNDSLTGGAAGDLLDGGAGDDVLTGGDGGDRLVGGEGNNKMFGGEGNDSMSAGLGGDLFDGGNGVDLADYSDRTANVSVVIDDAANDGQLVIKQSGTFFVKAVEGDNVKTNVEDVTTGSGNDSIIASVQNIANHFSGGAGNDRLRGRNGADVLDGGLGDDVLIGAGQNDLLRGGAGNDLLDGGADNDDLRGGDGNDILVGGTGVDQMRGDDGDDSIFAADNTVDGVIDGGAGSNFFSGDATDVFSNVQITD